MEWEVITLLGGFVFGASSLLVRNHRMNIIIDTGLAHQRQTLIAALRDNDLTPEAIDIVLNTHMHVDHSNNNCIFTKARILVSRHDYEWTLSLYERLRDMDENDLAGLREFYPEMESYNFSPKMTRKVILLERMVWRKENLGALEQYDWLESTRLPAGISILPSPGHVPHHTSFLIDASSHQVLVAGDALILRQDNGATATMTFPPQRRVLFDQSREHLLAHNCEIVPGHDDRFMNLVASEPRPAI